MSMMHERLRYYGKNLLRTYRSNHNCICCKTPMNYAQSSIYKNSFGRLLCAMCFKAYQKYNKGKKLQGEENLILRCVSMRVNK